MTARPRAIRVDDKLWADAARAAEDSGETLSDVIRDGLEKYVSDHARTSPRVARLTAQLRIRYPSESTVDLVRIVRTALETIRPNDDDAVLAYADGWLKGNKP